MKLLIRILLSALAVVVLANILPNVSVDSYITAIIVAVVLSLLNFIVKPILVILTLPVTIITFGLFLLIINAIIIFGVIAAYDWDFSQLFNFNAYSTAFFWGIGLAFHWVGVFGKGIVFSKKWEERKIKELMDKDKF